jgi:NAD(P)-dependent dehydrogenase (short-subunit alcohol dehydrogenase family)
MSTQSRSHVDAVAQKADAVDVSFNAIGIPQQNIQGVPLAELSAAAFSRPIMTYPPSHFLTARAAAQRMADKGSGVILTLTATPARLASRPLEAWLRRGRPWRALTRTLAAELGPQGVRVVCLRPDAIPETHTIEEVFGLHAKAMGIKREEVQAMMELPTLRRRLPTLSEVANTAAFIASERVSAMTGTVINLSGGKSSTKCFLTVVAR